MAYTTFGETGGLPVEYAPKQQDISRQLRLADMLRQQSQEAPQGQMVSGHYVNANPLQFLAKALQGYNAKKYEENANTQQQGLYKDYQDKQTSAAQKLAQALNPKQVQTGETSTMPAYTPEQQDQFGSPLPNVQRQSLVTPTYENKAPSPDDIRQAQMQYAIESGHPEMLGQIANSTAEHAINRADKSEDWTKQVNHEDALYNRGRADKISDVDAERKYQDIVRKDQQGFQVSQQDRQFAQQYKLQAQSLGAQAQQGALNRAQQAQLSASNKLKYDATRGVMIDERTGVATPVMQDGKPMAETSKPLTEAQGKAVLYGQRANDAHNILNDLEGKYSPMQINAQSSLSDTPLIGGIAGAVSNAVMSDNSQKAQQAQRNFVTAILRQESGATISPSEFDTAKKQYFPQAGDSKAVLDQKKANREAAINGFSTMSSGAFTPKYESARTKSNVRTVDW